MSQLIGAQNIMVEHNSPPSLLKGGGGIDFDYLHWRGGSEKKFKMVEVSCKGRSS